MDALKLRRLRHNEEGYLLLENLVTLMVILSVLVITYPMIVDWLVIREQRKADVELSRVLYESSVNWPDSRKTDRDYKIQAGEYSLIVEQNRQSMGVEIHAIHFSE